MLRLNHPGAGMTLESRAAQWDQAEIGIEHIMVFKNTAGPVLLTVTVIAPSFDAGRTVSVTATADVGPDSSVAVLSAPIKDNKYVTLINALIKQAVEAVS